MTLAHSEQFISINPGNAAAGNFDITCAVSVTPNAVCVIVEQNAGTTDSITSVTYGISTGAVPLARRRLDTETTEAGAVYIYWAAGTFPAGTQTLRIVRTGTLNMGAVVSTMTVTDPANFTVAVDGDATGTSTGIANPSWTLNTTAATNTVCYEGIHSGLNAMTNTPASGWTLQGSFDIGNQGRGYAQRTFTGGGLTCGWTAGTVDDFVGSSVAFKEVPITQQIAGAVKPVVAGRQTNPGREAPSILPGG